MDAKCGRDFTIALTDKGKVYSFGSDDYGQLGGVTQDKVESHHASVLPLHSLLHRDMNPCPT